MTEISVRTPIDKAIAMIQEATDATQVIDLRKQAAAAAQVVATRGATIEAINKIRILDLLCAKKLGEMSRELPKAKRGRKPKDISPRAGTKRKPTKTEFLEAAGLSSAEASRCERLAELSTAKIEEIAAAATAKGQQVSMRAAIAPSAKAGYDGDESYTPSVYVEPARELMGGIDLDVASCAFAQKTIKAGRFYTKKQDGRKQPWAGNLWFQPPYSLYEDFVGKLLAEWQGGNAMIKEAIAMLNFDSSTELHREMMGRFPFCMPPRISFIKPDGTPLKGNFYRQVIYYLGPESKYARFVELYGPLGLCAQAMDGQ